MTVIVPIRRRKMSLSLIVGTISGVVLVAILLQPVFFTL